MASQPLGIHLIALLLCFSVVVDGLRRGSRQRSRQNQVQEDDIQKATLAHLMKDVEADKLSIANLKAGLTYEKQERQKMAETLKFTKDKVTQYEKSLQTIQNALSQLTQRGPVSGPGLVTHPPRKPTTTRTPPRRPKFRCPASFEATAVNEQLHSCYHVSKVSMKNWAGAKKQCHRIGGYLVAIESAQENDFIKAMLKKAGLGKTYVYTGGNDKQTEGQYMWQGRNRVYGFTHTDWASGQPNNSGDDDDCVSMYTRGDKATWFTSYCHNFLRYVCEYSAK